MKTLLKDLIQINSKFMFGLYSEIINYNKMISSPLRVSITPSTSKAKAYKKSNLKAFADGMLLSAESSLIEAYLRADSFPLKFLGGERKVLSKPHALPNRALYIGEILESTPNGIGFQLDWQENYYEGYFENGTFSGKGRLFTSKGEIIQGEWADDKISQGTILNYDNKTYEGALEELKPHGIGQETCDDYVYKGNYYKSKKHGIGRIEWNDGTWYEGDFIMGRIEGKGKYHWIDTEYEGYWKANKMHGEGIQTWSDGSKYEGNMSNGLKEGFGIFTSDLRTYKGFWKKGKEDGKGILEENGNMIEGIWINGKLSNSENALKSRSNTIKTQQLLISSPSENPTFKLINYQDINFPENIIEKCNEILSIREKFGKFKWDFKTDLIITANKWKKFGKGLYYGESNTLNSPEGRGIWISITKIYEGYWLNGNHHGYGREINTFNEVYVGNWFNNVKFGFGVLTKRRAKYIGDWESNKFNGTGVLITDDLFYDGNWVNGLQHGKGTLEYSDKKIYIGEFDSGVISGNGTLILPNESRCEALWNNGEIIKRIKKNTQKPAIMEDDEDEIQDDYFQESKNLLHSLINN